MVDCKEPSGAMKKPEAVRLEQAPSAVSRLFRDCFAILGLLRRPTPDSCVLFTKLTCNPRSRNDVGLPTSMLRQQHSRISKSSSLSLLKAGIFCVAAYFWSTLQPKPYSIYWRKLFESVLKPVRQNGCPEGPSGPFGAELEAAEASNVSLPLYSSSSNSLSGISGISASGSSAGVSTGWKVARMAASSSSLTSG